MRTTVQTVDAVVAALQAATWTSPDEVTQPAFDRVDRFDISSKERAFQVLLTSEARVALVIYTGEEWDEHETSGSATLVLSRSQNILVLVSDRHLAKRDVAAFGNTTTPGALGLKDVVVQELAGRLIDHPYAVNIRPIRATVEIIQGSAEDDTFPNRVFCSIECLAEGGRVIAAQSNPVA